MKNALAVGATFLLTACISILLGNAEPGRTQGKLTGRWRIGKSRRGAWGEPDV